MAAVTITYQFDDDEALTITVEVDDSYPDAIAEARINAVRAYREAMGANTDATAELDDE